MLSRGVDLDIFVQLYAVWLVLIPGFGPLKYLRRLGGLIQALFMFNIAISGNLSFLNHMTIIPALACLDDACWTWPWRSRVAPKPGADEQRKAPSAILAKGTRWIVDLALVGTIAYLSMPVVKNLLQLEGRQMMNASFGAFRLVNTYGAFGNVGKERSCQAGRAGTFDLFSFSRTSFRVLCDLAMRWTKAGAACTLGWNG